MSRRITSRSSDLVSGVKTPDERNNSMYGCESNGLLTPTVAMPCVMVTLGRVAMSARSHGCNCVVSTSPVCARRSTSASVVMRTVSGVATQSSTTGATGSPTSCVASATVTHPWCSRMEDIVPVGVAREVRAIGLTSRIDPPATVMSSPVRRNRNLSPGMRGKAPAKRMRTLL